MTAHYSELKRQIFLSRDFAVTHGPDVLRAHKVLANVLNEGRVGNFPSYDRVCETLGQLKDIPYAGTALRLPYFTRRSYYERYLNGLSLGDAVSVMAFHAKWSDPTYNAQDHCVGLMWHMDDVYNGDVDLIGQDPRVSETGEERFELVGPGAAALQRAVYEVAGIKTVPGKNYVLRPVKLFCRKTLPKYMGLLLPAWPGICSLHPWFLKMIYIARLFHTSTKMIWPLVYSHKFIRPKGSAMAACGVMWLSKGRDTSVFVI